jgi:hypothetical protein
MREKITLSMSIGLGIPYGQTPYSLDESCGKLMGSKTQLDNGGGDMVLTTLSSLINPSQTTKLSTDVNNPVYRNPCDL